MKNTYTYLLLLINAFVLTTFFGCTNNNLRSKAKIKSEELLDAIGNGNANDLFPAKYFPVNIFAEKELS